jgi:antitoxin ParD1/3/4
MKTNAQKVSVSIERPLYRFIDDYQSKSHKSRSEIINEAVKLLREHQLEVCYKEANSEIDNAFDITVGDGLEDETW